MSSAEVGEEHLKKTLLTGTKVKDILSELKEWLVRAHFEVADPNKSELLRICNDLSRDEAFQPLLIELDPFTTPYV
ncbi:MAG: hypothetical protein L6R40_005233 [Gallowayella cf. fulva]|nr:MAG: hypothetical protein L6R40_005233 [Xanthomendoza cf. fulva]